MSMEDWQLDFEWLRIQHVVKDLTGHADLPGLQGILMLIGVQELGIVQYTFSKEEKQDLMHIAICKLLSFEGYYEFTGRDQDEWPHYELKRPVPYEGAKEQEVYIKKKIVQYFSLLELTGEGLSAN